LKPIKKIVCLIGQQSADTANTFISLQKIYNKFPISSERVQKSTLFDGTRVIFATNIRDLGEKIDFYTLGSSSEELESFADTFLLLIISLVFFCYAQMLVHV
jgi:hypothetical protein